MNKEMFKDFLEMIKQFAELDITKTNSFKSRIMFRNYLIGMGISAEIANRLVINADFELSEELTDDELKELVEAYSTGIANYVKALLMNNGFTFEDVKIIKPELKFS